MISIIHSLYVDGGVILKNPSTIGGTYAFCLVADDEIKVSSKGFITPDTMKTPTVTNNQTEMLALIRGLQTLPFDFEGTIYSDSSVTLGRAFRGFGWNNIPLWMKVEFDTESKRLHLHNYNKIKHVLLAGHPTKAQLACGIGRHGLPVSKYNVWCDKACGEAAEAFLAGDFGKEIVW